MERNRLLLVDGMALLFRGFFATAVRKQFMYNLNSVPTNGVQGYLRYLLTAAKELEPTHLAVCWDMGSATFRNDIFGGYKSNRGLPPEELLPQFDLAKEATEALEIPNIGLAGFEADDCIGTLARQMRGKAEVTVLTGDRDLLQILESHVDVWIMQKGLGNYAKFSETNFAEAYGVMPPQLVDVKALMGDSSDGYPGVKGIGEKTAIKLIREFDSIEGLLDNLETLSPNQRNKIESDLDMLHISRKLAAIKCDLPLSMDMKEAAWQISGSALEFADLHGLTSVRSLLSQVRQTTEEPFSQIGLFD